MNSRDEEETKRGIWSRRDFFTRLGWGGFGLFGIATLLGFLRSAFPRVLFEPPKGSKQATQGILSWARSMRSSNKSFESGS
jgi:hypothetical protein